MISKQFGGKITNAQKEKYARSKQWDGTKFVNLEVTTMEISWQNIPKLLYKQFCEKKEREPKAPIPIIPFDKTSFLHPMDTMKFIWYGHSAILMRISGLTLLIDPMLGPNTSPIAPFATKRFSENTLDLIDEFPEIDLLLLSHDHYDHLDYDSIKKLKSKTKHFYVALGVARHLIKWGVDASKITEFDWWQLNTYEGIDITFTPTRHFSGRGLTDRSKSLWGGWAFKTAEENIWFSGDSGYGTHFKEIGKRLGPFDFAFMECGQYNKNWHEIHMYPEESVQAAMDARAHKIMPVHWAGFALAQHDWTDPINRFIQEATKQNIAYGHPAIGALFSYYEMVNNRWWDALK